MSILAKRSGRGLQQMCEISRAVAAEKTGAIKAGAHGAGAAETKVDGAATAGATEGSGNR